jgi:hypothetical protein
MIYRLDIDPTPTSREIGRKGAATRNERLRAPIREQADRMRAELGMGPGPWRRN